MLITNRLAYLDWLRILAIVGVLVFHSAMPYVAEWEWHIKNKETSNLLMEFNFWLSRFRMPLLFFVSGAITHIMLQKRTASAFVGLRLKRLLIPLAFGMLAIVPFQVYMERLTQGFKGNFFQFYPSIFTTGAYPEGNLSWHHLWFIAYLFVYDVLLAPFFKWMMRHKQKPSALRRLAVGKKIYFLMIPSVVLFSSMVPYFPETHDLINDWAYHPYWMFFLLAGFICMNIPSLLQSLENNRRASFGLAFLTIVILNYLRWNNLEPAETSPQWLVTAYIALYPLTAWFWVFTAVGYGKRYLNKQHSALNYLNGAVYPFYILHQTVIVVLSFYVVQVSDTILMKYLFTVLVTFFLSMAVFHLFIRPFNIARFLFGMKAKSVKKEPAVPEMKTGAVVMVEERV